jgi:hypothetical protein
MCRVTRLFRPTDRLVRILLAPALVFIATAIDRNYQTDLWHHLARGRVLVEEGVLLNTDRFTFTVTGQPFRDVNWGWQAAFYWLFRAGGLPLVQTVNSAVLALMMGLLCALARRRCGSAAVACGVCVAAFLGLWPLLIIRPQTLSLLLFVVLMAVLEAASYRPRALFLPPIIMALWVNLHGGFPVGLVLIGSYLLAAGADAIALGSVDGSRRSVRLIRACWPWLFCLAASVAGTLLNPYGWHVYEYVGLTSGRASGRHIDEWLPPGLDTLTGKVFALSIAATLLLSALPGRRPSLREVIVGGCFLLPACGSVRMVAWWLLVCTPLLASRVADACPRLRSADADDDRSSVSAGVVSLLLLSLCVLSLPWLEAYNPVLRMPGRGHRTETDLQAAAEHIAQEGGRRIFTRFAWGEYLGWTLYPRGSVFMDGRIEIFPDEVWQQYVAITQGRADWEELLDQYQVDCLLLDSSGYDGQLLALVENSDRWYEVFRQGNAVLFLRREPSAKTIGPRTRKELTLSGPRADKGN